MPPTVIRRALEVLSLLVCLAGPSLAQERWLVLDAEAELPPRSLLSHYLRSETDKHFAARREAVAALATPEDVLQRQAELKQKFLSALGELPERTPLNAQVVHREERDGYSVEKLVYESRPGHHVTALLYLPAGQPPFPAVLTPCGHTKTGKATGVHQRIGISLALNGIAALCHDPIGQGERNQLLDAAGQPVVGATTEHTLVGIGALLVGDSAATYHIWDGLRSLDYLASRPEIDASRLGCTGNSGGGMLTAYLMALDERIVAAAPSCYITSLERLFATIGPQDAEQNVVGQVALGIEQADFLAMRTPRPTLILAGTQDFFDIDGTWTSFREAKGIYGIMGYGERVDLFEYNDKHGFSLPRRQAALRWMRRWLLDIDEPIDEPKFTVAEEASLLCTRTGQALTEYGGISAFDISAAKAQRLAAARADKLASLETIRRRLALPERIDPASIAKRPRSERAEFNVQPLAFMTEDGPPIPAIHLEPKVLPPLDERRTVIYLHQSGKETGFEADGPFLTLLGQGSQIVALDVRGWGEMASGRLSRGGGNYWGVDGKAAFVSMHLGRPLLGQRVQDVLSVIGALDGQATGKLEIWGEGAAAMVALHVAALEPRITRTTLRHGTTTWESVVNTPLAENQLGNVVPGVLIDYDLPELAVHLVPRRLAILDAADGGGRSVDQTTLEAAYAVTRAAYQAAGAGEALRLEATVKADSVAKPATASRSGQTSATGQQGASSQQAVTGR